jgi:hypothetical protein
MRLPAVLTPLLLVPVLLAAGCRGADAADAARHNDRIVLELEQASRRMAAFYTAREPDAGQLDALESYLAAAEDRLRGLPPHRRDDRLRREALGLVDFYARLCREQNRSLLDLTRGPYYTVADSLLVQRLLAAVLVEENRRNTRFLAVQDSFAGAHGLLLVEPLP